MDDFVKKLAEAVKRLSKEKTTAYDTPATVRRIEGDTAWVHIPGGVDETPVKLTMSAKTGDEVQVRVSGGKAWLQGNVSAPPTDDTRAVQAEVVAGGAKLTAESAMADAEVARTAADSAVASAGLAGQAASIAQAAADAAQATADTKKTVFVTQPTPPYHVGDLWARIGADLEDFVDSNGNNIVDDQGALFQAAILRDAAAWVCLVPKLEGQEFDEADWELTTADTNLREWFWHDANGAHVLGDETGFRNDIDSTGMHIIDTTDETSVAEFGATGAQIGQNASRHMTINTDGLKFFTLDENNNLIPVFLASGAGLISGRGCTSTGWYGIAAGENCTCGPWGGAIGYGCETYGENGIALGCKTYARAESQCAVGEWNTIDTTEDDEGFQATDRAFIVGNGTSSNRSDAFYVRKNGNAYLGGNLEAAGEITDGGGNVLSDKADASAIITPDDYVTSQGTSGDWRYRKWHSGKIEAWFEGTFSCAASTTARGALYYSTWSLSIPNDIGFTATPNTLIGNTGDSNTVIAVNGAATSATAMSGKVWRYASSSSALTISARIYAWQD